MRVPDESQILRFEFPLELLIPQEISTDFRGDIFGFDVLRLPFSVPFGVEEFRAHICREAGVLLGRRN